MVDVGGALEVKGGHFVGCSVAIEGIPAGGRAHGLTERLPGAGSGIASFANGPGSRCGWAPRHRFSAR